jgi:hypothetical protein
MRACKRAARKLRFDDELGDENEEFRRKGWLCDSCQDGRSSCLLTDEFISLGLEDQLENSASQRAKCS